jgi:hypothetical protein
MVRVKKSYKPDLTGVASFKVYVSDVIGHRFEKIGRRFENFKKRT